MTGAAPDGSAAGDPGMPPSGMSGSADPLWRRALAAPVQAVRRLVAVLGVRRRPAGLDDGAGLAGVPAPARALLLVHAPAEAAAAWARRGLALVAVVPLTGGWTAVVPAKATSEVPAPYDDAASVVLSRRVSPRLRPALGFRTVGARMLVSVVPAGRRAGRRWVAWDPGRGFVRPGGLPTGTPTQLAMAAGVDPRHTRVQLEALVATADAGPDAVLAAAFELLGLPGSGLLTGTSRVTDHPGARLVAPDRHYGAGFRRAVHDERSWLAELEGPR